MINGAPLTFDQLRFTLALSAIATGLDHIERGKIDRGAKCARQGLEFLRMLADEQKATAA